MNDLIPVQETKLDLLAARANKAHGKTISSLRKAIHHAKEAGDALRAAKLRVGHFNWLKWLKVNFDASAETARVYMRISMYWDTQLLPAMEKDEGLTIEMARQILRRPNRTCGEDIENGAVPRAQPEADMMKDELKRYFRKWLADMPEIGIFCLYSIWDKAMRDVLDQVMVEMERCRVKGDEVPEAEAQTVGNYRFEIDPDFDHEWEDGNQDAPIIAPEGNTQPQAKSAGRSKATGEGITHTAPKDRPDRRDTRGGDRREVVAA